MSNTTYLTLSEASKITKVKVETLKKRCQAGKYAGAVKKGKTWLIPSFALLKKTRKKVGVYIDGSNIYHGGKAAGWPLDYQKLRDFIERKYQIKIISYYNSTGYKQDKNKKYVRDKKGNFILDPGALRFENWLRGLGFRVITKPVKFIQGDEHLAANKMDGELIVDALLEENQWDEFILLSGDSDFERLVAQISSKQKPVHIFSFSTRMAYELKTLAFKSAYVSYTELEDLESVLRSEKKA